MGKRDKLNEALDAWRKDIDSEPFNSGELERKSKEQAENAKDDPR